MLLKFEVVNNKNYAIGNSTITLNWTSRTWLLTEDKTDAWKRISQAKTGKFEYKDWGVIWMWDQGKNIVIVHDAPSKALDFDTLKGTARLYEPYQNDMKDAILKWTLDLGQISKFSAIINSPLPFSRAAYIGRLNWLMPAPYLSVNNDILTDRLRKDDPKVAKVANYTSCGSLPGFVSKQVAFSKGLKGDAFNRWMGTFSLNGTHKVRDTGVKYGCWVEAAPNKKPKPGDVYVLLDRGKTDRKADGISHVGIFEMESGNNWSTFDLGQSGGFDGKKNSREYKPATTELYGESNQGGGFRTIAGWVDLERYWKV